MTQKTIGYIFGVLNILIYGLSPIAAHYAVGKVDPLLLGGMATLLGSFYFLAKSYREPKLGLAPKTDVGTYWLIALFAAVATILFFLGTKYTSGINTALLVQIEPLYAITLGILYFGEQISHRQVIAVVLMIIGAGVVVYKGHSPLAVGDILILLAPLLFQFSHFFSKKIIGRVKNINTIPGFRLFFSGSLLLVIVAAYHPIAFLQLAHWHIWLIILLYAALFRALNLDVWYQALKRISLSQATSLIPLSVIVSFAGSLLVFNEVATQRQLAGLLCIFVGVSAYAFSTMRTQKGIV